MDPCLLTENNDLMHMSREEVVAYLLGSIYILPIAERGSYLFGTTSEKRAVCLVSRHENNGRIDRPLLLQAAQEVQRAGLLAPILFFGYTKVICDDAFTFAQLPLSDHDTAILHLLQGMRLNGVLHPLHLVS